jgi:hypothetical protein
MPIMTSLQLFFKKGILHASMISDKKANMVNDDILSTWPFHEVDKDNSNSFVDNVEDTYETDARAISGWNVSSRFPVTISCYHFPLNRSIPRTVIFAT